jgi:outer membrane protein assembly factor BamA
VGDLAAANGLTIEQLRVAVEEGTALSWAEYREELAAQILDMRLAMSTQHWASAAGFGAPAGGTEASQSQHMEAARVRMLGCLRARADVSVKDDAVELPENPFAIAATLAGVRFVGDPKVPAADLEAAAKAAAAGRPLCDSLAAAEVAMTDLYRERGYLDAQVMIPWPKTPGTTIVEVEAVPGTRHVLGEVDVDQSAAPKAKRVKEKELRRRIAAIGKTGEVAGISKLRGIVDVVEGALRDAGLGPVDVQTERKAGSEGEDVRVDLVVRVRASGA